MPSTRPPSHDPFISSSSASLQNQTSQQSLRSNASAASPRTRQQRDYLAPTNPRYPTSRTIDDDVLADAESEQELVTRRPRPQFRKIRNGSPAEGKHSRLKSRQQSEEQDIVNRRPDGSYFLEGTAAPGAPLTSSVYASGQQSDHDGMNTPGRP